MKQTFSWIMQIVGFFGLGYSGCALADKNFVVAGYGFVISIYSIAMWLLLKINLNKE